jgi:PAS domain S-box-containing protein
MTRALIVDDKDENVFYLRALLEADGCEVESAHNGAEALAKARQTLPDVVISDLLMPVMDGYTLLRHWKSDERSRGIPFIVYTATYTAPADEKLALNLGADAFILKPAEPEEFLARLHSVRASGTTATSKSLPSPPGENEALLQAYSEALVRKLEQKMLQLEESNRSLQEDIAARERAEAALRQSEADFRLLTEVMPQLVWIARADGANIFCNQRWVEYTGLTLAASAGDGWLEPFHPDDRAGAEAAWRHARQVEATYSHELRLRRLDGVYRWWLVRAMPVRDARGGVTRWFGTCTDIDDIKETAAKLLRTEEQLRQAQKMEAIGQLSAGMAHDFNNVLSVILSYASFIIDDLSPGDRLRSDVEEIRIAGQRAAELTMRLLTFSRQQVLTPRQVDLREIVSGLDNMLRRLIGDDIQLSVIAEDQLGKAFADAGQVEQVILNLIVNARDAMPTGGCISIELANATLDAAYALEHRGVVPGRYTRLAVSDTGHGMDAQTRARIFEPFVTTKPNGKGTGLGLAIVYGIVTQSGGHISVRTEPRVGTTFEVYLPRQVDGTEPEVTAEATHRVRLRGYETVLVVENADPVRAIVASGLRRAGYKVLEAQNGGEALLICEQYPEPIHLLLTDVIMPRMSGKALAERVSRTRPEMRVLYMSGHARDNVVHYGVLEGGVGFLPKPITPDALLVKAREILDAELPQRQSASSAGTGASSVRPAAAAPEHVLHVDDEGSMVQLTKRILERLGYRVSGFRDPLAALQAFRADPAAFDAIIVNVTMPGMDGFQLVRQLRLQRADVPIVVMSDYFRPEDIVEAESLGLRALLAKPDTVKDLGRVLHDEIQRVRRTRVDV